MIDPLQIFLIGGILLVVLLRWVLPLIFQNKHARIARYFRQNQNIRFQLVLDLSKNASVPLQDLSPTEMVAVLTLIYLNTTVSDSHATAQRFAAHGWANKFSDEFFDRLYSTARAFSAKRWNEESIDLFRLGQLIAQSNNNSHWSREFAASVQRLQYRQVQGGLPTKMK
jgi:hypothetical protein